MQGGDEMRIIVLIESKRTVYDVPLNSYCTSTKTVLQWAYIHDVFYRSKK